MIRIGIIGAMEKEVRALEAALENKRERTAAGMRFCEGQLRGVPAVVVQCGIGKVNAGICAQALCDRYEVTHIVNTGVAGSLSARIDIGDVVISSAAVQHDMDVTALGYEPGLIPGLRKEFPADEGLRRLALESAREAAPEVGAHEGLVVSGDRFIAGREQKERLADGFGGLCAEMEGAAIAQAAYLNGVPFVIIRAISDKADDSGHMDYRAFVEQAAERSTRIVLSMTQRLGAPQR